MKTGSQPLGVGVMPQDQGAPAAVNVRLTALRLCAKNAARSHWVQAADSLFFGVMSRSVSVVCIFVALALIERSHQAAWWWCLATLASLLVDWVFNPPEEALRHARREVLFLNLLQDLDMLGPSIDADTLTRYEAKAVQLISRY